MFVTLWLGVLELSTGRLTFVNAGHEDAMLCRKGAAVTPLQSKHHFVVGTMPNVPYRDCEARLEVGEKLLLFTDGVTEATDAENRMFTRERLVEALNECCDRSPQEILETVHMRVDAFTGSAPQFDDLTMLCVERTARSGVGRSP